MLWEDSDLPELVGGYRQGEEAGGPAPALSINSSSLWAPNTNVKHTLVARWLSAALYHAHPFLFLSAFLGWRMGRGWIQTLPVPPRPAATAAASQLCLSAPQAGREGVFLQSGANK